jgi:hypothetical protein
MSRKFGPERSLIELYIIIFLNKLKIVQNKKMKKINKTKRLWLRLCMRHFRDSQAPSWLSGPRTDVPAEPPSHMPRDPEE